MRLSGWNAVVTGASSGIGAAAARAFAAEGARVLLGARSEPTVRALAEEIRRTGAKAEAARLDVTDEASVRAFAALARERLGSVDLLLNNAGIAIRNPLLKTATEDWDAVLGTNLRGAFLVLREVAPLMLDGPRLRTILNVASVVGTIAVPGNVSYVASKWGLRGLSQAFALEIAGRGVRVVSVNPGYVATPLTHGARTPQAEMMQPEEVAEALVRVATLPEGVQVDDLTLYPSKLYTS